jgi:FxsC-like protein
MREGYMPRAGAGYVPRAAADDGPYFFLSFAHTPRDDHAGQDPDLWIAQFYSDLCDHVALLADLPPGVKPGFMDREIRQGYEWSWRLSQALATCRVFVPLYSRRYFRSEHCGKEWFAFSRRMLNQKAGNVRAREAIVPALWIPVPHASLPAVAQSVHFKPSDFGELYAEHGFYGTMKVRRWREDYEAAVYLLACRIVEVAEGAPAASGPPEPYESLPSAFGGTDQAGPGDKPVWLTVVAPHKDELPEGRDHSYYGSDVREWNPYRGDSVCSLAAHAADLARGLSYTPVISDLDRHGAELTSDYPPAGPEVLLIDPWSVLRPEYREILRRLDSMDKPWVQVIIVWNPRDAQLATHEQRIKSALGDALPRKLREGRAASASAVRGVPSLEDFGMVLPAVIAAAGRHYLRLASASVPEEAAE